MPTSRAIRSTEQAPVRPIPLARSPTVRATPIRTRSAAIHLAAGAGIALGRKKSDSRSGQVPVTAIRPSANRIAANRVSREIDIRAVTRRPTCIRFRRTNHPSRNAIRQPIRCCVSDRRDHPCGRHSARRRQVHRAAQRQLLDDQRKGLRHRRIFQGPVRAQSQGASGSRRNESGANYFRARRIRAAAQLSRFVPAAAQTRGQRAATV